MSRATQYWKTQFVYFTKSRRGYDRQASQSLKPYSAYYVIPFAEAPVGVTFLAPSSLSWKRAGGNNHFKHVPGCVLAAWFAGSGRRAGSLVCRFRAACWQPGLPVPAACQQPGLQVPGGVLIAWFAGSGRRASSLVCRFRAACWQPGLQVPGGVLAAWFAGSGRRASSLVCRFRAACWQPGLPVSGGVLIAWFAGSGRRAGSLVCRFRAACWQPGLPVPAACWQPGLQVPGGVLIAWFAGSGRRASSLVCRFRAACWQPGLQIPGGVLAAWFAGSGRRASSLVCRFREACWQPGLPVSGGVLIAWFAGSGRRAGSLVCRFPAACWQPGLPDERMSEDSLGFLSSGDGALPGNLGLQDQVLAHQWVKENIGRFGGDADDVTIFGESAGSASVAALSLTPSTRELFNTAIMQSGTILSPWALVKNPRKQVYEHSKNTGCFPRIYNPWDKHGYHESIVSCLKRKLPREVLDAQEELDYSDLLIKSIEESPFFGPSPASLLADRAYLRQIGALDRSYILGLNDNEGALLGSIVPRGDYSNFTKPSNVASLTKSTVHSYLDRSPGQDALNLIDFLYSFPREANNKIPLQNVFDLNSDLSYVVPTILFARALTKASTSTPIYLYMFDAEPQLKDLNGLIKGTSHGWDIYFEFEIASSELDRLIFFYADPDPVMFPILTEAFTRFITSFDKTAAPVTNGISSWPRFDMDQERYVAISTAPEVRERMFAQRVALWTDFLPRMAASSWFWVADSKASVQRLN
ncbi:hypothetical protein RRG08_040271 [Elysia crispata]|uniref:Carboxylesterase type B domain-containing protein n=1 Tax=Elysia crispata TaxID=231223 RepID=A0AAE0YAC2_9GAST|nr:hypothetical protein RRG08_040271 [Elysia crispata]